MSRRWILVAALVGSRCWSDGRAARRCKAGSTTASAATVGTARHRRRRRRRGRPRHVRRRQRRRWRRLQRRLRRQLDVRARRRWRRCVPNPIPANAGCKAAEDCGSRRQRQRPRRQLQRHRRRGLLLPPRRRREVLPRPARPPRRRRLHRRHRRPAPAPSSAPGARASAPSARPPRRCDKLDNDCNGCADDGLCCNAAIDCPAPGDPRIAPQAPYTDVALKGELFFPGARDVVELDHRRRPVRPALLRHDGDRPIRASRSPAPP